MEQKPENNQAGTPTPAGTSNVNAAAEKILEDVKKFNILSLVGLGLVLLFFVFFMIPATNYKWWLMLLIAGAAGFLLYRQHADTRGFEQKICFYGLIALIVLFVFRDIGMSMALDNPLAALQKAISTGLGK